MSEFLASTQTQSNVYQDRKFHVRATFGASSAVTFKALGVTMAKTGTGQWKLTLPEVYTEVTSFEAGWFRADSQNVLSMQIVTNNIAVDGTLTVEALTSAGVATAPAQGDIAFIVVGASRDVLNGNFTGTG